MIYVHVTQWGVAPTRSAWAMVYPLAEALGTGEEGHPEAGRLVVRGCAWTTARGATTHESASYREHAGKLVEVGLSSMQAEVSPLRLRKHELSMPISQASPNA